MYMECQGQGSPTVLLLSGADGASDLWHAAGQKGPTVYGSVARFTRVCAYDRPGTLRSDGERSRSDPVPQPTTTQDAVDDLDALLKAADVSEPYVLAAHSYGGLMARVFASEHPDEVTGIVFVDALGPEVRAQMTPAEWTIWKGISGPPPAPLRITRR
jgi:pimeloyl-ACP methyl ester carboxylesterase